MTGPQWRRLPDGTVVRQAAQPAPASGPAEKPAHRPSLRIALRVALRDCWDHLGVLLLASLLTPILGSSAVAAGFWAASAMASGLPGQLPFLASLLLAQFCLSLVLGPLAGGLFRFCRNAAARSEPEMLDLLWGFRDAPGLCLRLALLQGGTLLLLGINCAFYFTWRNLPGYLLGMLTLYGLLFWLVTSLYHWPFVAQGETRVRTIVRKSALLVLDNGLYSLGLALAWVLVTVLLWMIVLPGALLRGGCSAMLATQATRELLRKYGVLPPDPTLDPIADETTQFRVSG